MFWWKYPIGTTAWFVNSETTKKKIIFLLTCWRRKTHINAFWLHHDQLFVLIFWSWMVQFGENQICFKLHYNFKQIYWCHVLMLPWTWILNIFYFLFWFNGPIWHNSAAGVINCEKKAPLKQVNIIVWFQFWRLLYQEESKIGPPTYLA